LVLHNLFLVIQDEIHWIIITMDVGMKIKISFFFVTYHLLILSVEVVTKDKLLWMVLMRVVKLMMHAIRAGIPRHHIT
jgi:hypothetical protein